MAVTVPTTLAEALALLADNTTRDITPEVHRAVITYLAKNMQESGGQDLAIDAIADGKFLKRNGVKIEGADAGGTPATLKHIAPRWYGPIPEFGPPSTLSANDLHVIPIEIPETTDYDAMGLTSPTPAGSVKFAVYDSDNGGFPGTKLKDFGSVAVSSTTILAITKFSLPVGFRWLAMIVSTFVGVDTIDRAGGDSVWESLTGRALLTGAFQGGFTISGETFAAGLPADLSLSATPIERVNVAHVNIRKA